MSIHDNAERGRMIIRALKECVACSDDVTMATMAEKLPRDFDLLDSEISEALAELAGVSDTESQPPLTAAVGGGDGGDANELGDQSGASHAVADAAPITQARARQMVEAAHKRLDIARLNVRLAQERHTDTKATLAKAVTAWQQNADPLTAEQRRARELRNHLKGEMEQRQRRGVPKMDTSKHAAFDPVSGRTGFKGNRRGALPSSFQHRNVNSVTMFQGKVPGTKA